MAKLRTHSPAGERQLLSRKAFVAQRLDVDELYLEPARILASKRRCSGATIKAAGDQRKGLVA